MRYMESTLASDEAGVPRSFGVHSQAAAAPRLRGLAGCWFQHIICPTGPRRGVARSEGV